MLTRSLFLASMFALALPACGGQTDLAADDSSLADDEAKFDRTSGGSTGYFVIRRDMKRCAAPACGGDYVKRVNYSDIKCQDGKSGTNGECYVASVDYGKAGLTADESASFSGKSIIVKGTIAKQTINGKSWGNLVVTEVWAPAVDTGSESVYAKVSGTMYRVKDNGIRCITTPCISDNEAKINGTTSRNVAGLDLQSVGATDDQISDAYVQTTLPDGLLVDGYNSPVSGPGGTALQLVGTNFFTKVVHVDNAVETCGTIAGLTCSSGKWCDPTLVNACTAADLGGVCKITQLFCTAEYKPVCGCNGQTYGNDCNRIVARIQKAHDGACN